MAADLCDVLRAAGVDHRDARVPGRPWPFSPRGIMVHHTAGPRRAAELNGLTLMQRGRASLPGPLCHVYVGRFGGVAVITDGYANHAGSGCRHVLAAVMRGDVIPADPGPDRVGGGGHFFGIEIENDGRGEPYTDAAMLSVERVVVAVMRHHDWGAKHVIGHKEWTRRKIDPLYDMADFRSRIAARIQWG